MGLLCQAEGFSTVPLQESSGKLKVICPSCARILGLLSFIEKKIHLYFCKETRPFALLPKEEKQWQPIVPAPGNSSGAQNPFSRWGSGLPRAQSEQGHQRPWQSCGSCLEQPRGHSSPASRHTLEAMGCPGSQPATRASK